MKPIEDEFRQIPPDYLAYEQKKKLGWSFTPETMAELLARPEPKLEWLIQDLWVDKSRGFIAGHPGVGKTWIALEMLLSISSGQVCLGRYAPVVTGATLLVEEEGSLLNLARRVHALARARNLKDSDLINFHHITRQFLKIPKHEKELIAFIKAKDIKFVVFDSLRRMHNAKENSSDDMQPILESFARINFETQASLLLIHHLSKTNDKESHKSIFERMRGSGDLWAWRDCILGIEGEEESDTCKCSFQFRDAEAPDPILIKRHVGETTGAIALEAIGIDETEEFADKSAMIIDFMRSQFGSVSKDAVFKAVKGGRNEFYRVFQFMAKRGLVVKNGSGWTVRNE